MGERLDLLSRPLPTGFEARLLVLGPGEEVDYEPSMWRDALVEVDCGEVELSFRSGVRRRVRAGDVLWLTGLGLEVIHNRSRDPAVLAGVSRPIQGGSDRPPNAKAR